MPGRRALKASVFLVCGIGGGTSAAAPPSPARKPVIDTYYGEVLADPYRWMEAGGPEFTAWAEAQGDSTRQRLTSLPGYADLASALTQTDRAGSLSSLAKIEAAEAVQTNGFGSALCSAR